MRMSQLRGQVAGRPVRTRVVENMPLQPSMPVLLPTRSDGAPVYGVGGMGPIQDVPLAKTPAYEQG